MKQLVSFGQKLLSRLASSTWHKHDGKRYKDMVWQIFSRIQTMKLVILLPPLRLVSRRQQIKYFLSSYIGKRVPRYTWVPLKKVAQTYLLICIVKFAQRYGRSNLLDKSRSNVLRPSRWPPLREKSEMPIKCYISLLPSAMLTSVIRLSIFKFFNCISEKKLIVKF